MRHEVATRFACAAAFALTTLFVRSALANEPTVELDYEAPAACPTDAAFRSEVRARIAERPTAAIDARRFRARIVESQGGTYLGTLETADPPSVREVSGASCEEVVRALVVFVALAVSPPASEEPSSSTVVAPPPAVTAPPRSEPPPKQQPERPVRGPFGLGMDVRAMAGVGVAPGIVPGGAVSARFVLERRPRFRWIGHAGGLVAYGDKPVSSGAFEFLWSAARIDVGPALDVGGFRLSGGPALRAGVLSVQARHLPAAGRYSSFWGDVGAFVRVDRELAPAVALSLMAELAVPVQRRTFGIEGVEKPVHEIAPVIGVVSFGVALGR